MRKRSNAPIIAIACLCVGLSAGVLISGPSQSPFLANRVTEYPALIEKMRIALDDVRDTCVHQRLSVLRAAGAGDDVQLQACAQARRLEIRLERAQNEFKARLCAEQK